MTLLSQLTGSLPERFYVGVDVGYREHVAVAISLQAFAEGEDRWKRARCLSFPSTRAGLDRLQKYLDTCSTDHRAFLGLCEPTGGFYGASLYQYLVDQGYPMWLVANATTRHMRERIFGGLPKTDEMDARVMARIAYLHEAVGEEFTLRPLQIPAPDNGTLLALCRDSWKLGTLITRARNQFAQLMAVIFPELKTFFTQSVSTWAPVSLIATYPTPALLAEATEEEVRETLRQARAYTHAEAVAELQQLARNSSGVLPDPGRAWRLAWLTQFLLTNFKAQAELDHQIEAELDQRADYPLIQHVPYAGPPTLGVILAATGDVKRFRNYRRYVAYTGYFAGLEKSQTIDRTRMSKKGNRDLKRAYFLIGAPLVWFDRGDNPYKSLYQRKRAEGRAWYEAMPFVCAALARHIYHCLKSGEPYSVDKVFKDSRPTPASSQALDDLRADLDEKFEVMDTRLAATEG